MANMLTYTKYLEMSALRMSESEFTRYIGAAENVINVVTRRFYDFNSFDADVEWRKNAYLRAIVDQVDYFGETGASSMEAINAQPQSITIGRTSLSKGSRGSSVVEEKRSLLSFGAELALQQTGLLNRGVKR